MIGGVTSDHKIANLGTITTFFYTLLTIGIVKPIVIT